MIRRAAACVLMLAMAATPAPAGASDEPWAINGTFRATSDGVWAKSNEVFHDEPVVVSTWTITTTCTDAVTCTGPVVSDQGWTATIRSVGGEYIVDREIPNWEVCPDGTGMTGRQRFRFYPTNRKGLVVLRSPFLEGFDQTTGVTGACGINRPLVITIPFTLEKIG